MNRPCPHFPNCVGCALIGRLYGEQLRLKHQRVAEAFARFPTTAALPIAPVIGSPRAFGYRNQAKLVARRVGRGLRLGLYRPGSHQVVDIRQCPTHHPLINRALAIVAEAVEHYGIPIYDERTRAGILRYVVVRVSNWAKTVQVILVTHGRSLPQARELVRALVRRGTVVSVVQNVNADPGNVIFGPTFVPLTRDATLIERVGALKLKTHAGAFLQANIPVARKLYEHALQWVAPQATEIAADLYCGVGAMAFHLGTAAKLVVGIEESPIAVADAKANARFNGFHNIRVDCGVVAKLLPEWRQRVPQFDILTLNPPRKGVDAETRAAIIACAAKRVAYISCDPTTLARDLDWFAAHDYRTMQVQPFDLLPQTDHVECVAALVRE